MTLIATVACGSRGSAVLRLRSGVELVPAPRDSRGVLRVCAVRDAVRPATDPELDPALGLGTTPGNRSDSTIRSTSDAPPCDCCCDSETATAN